MYAESPSLLLDLKLIEPSEPRDAVITSPALMLPSFLLVMPMSASLSLIPFTRSSRDSYLSSSVNLRSTVLLPSLSVIVPESTPFFTVSSHLIALPAVSLVVFTLRALASTA